MLFSEREGKHSDLETVNSTAFRYGFPSARKPHSNNLFGKPLLCVTEPGSVFHAMLSRPATVDLVSNALLLAVVAVAWGYVLYAGAVASQRYLDTVDLTQFAKDERVPEFLEKIDI